MKFFIVIVLYLIVVACTPASYVYVKHNGNSKIEKIKQVIIVVEYLDLKDDIKGLWNFEENINLSKQNELFEIARGNLMQKGYEVSTKSLKTSGLVMARDFLVDHYIGKQQQDYPISPPYIVRSIGMNDEEIQIYEQLLAQLTRPVSQVMSDYRAFVKTNFLEQTKRINYQNRTALFVIQAYKPRVSPFSNIDIGVSTSSRGNGAFIGFGSQTPKSATFAYLIDVISGDLLWSNKTTAIKASNQQKFFNELPNHNN